jgi:uncharacterized RDD family membrane protein YckC
MVQDVNNKKSYAEMAIPTSQRLMIGPASPLKRIIAFCIDILLINFIVLTPFNGILAKLIPSKDIFQIANQTVTINLLITSLFIGIIMLLYFVLFEYTTNQTPGKMFFGLFVVSTRIKNKKIQKLSLGQTIFRNLQVIPVFPFILLLLIDPIFVFFGQSNQRLLEIVSKTVVIERYQYDNQY